MLKWLLFTYIGLKLNAGAVYYVACGIGFIGSTIKYGYMMYNLGKEED